MGFTLFNFYTILLWLLIMHLYDLRKHIDIIIDTINYYYIKQWVLI